jgi:D-aminoacyl-tRNA deacylase
VQRVSEAQVSVEASVAGSIRKGLLVFVGISREDTIGDADYAVQKIIGLRIFPDAEGKMNCNVQEAGGALLIVSQFTLYGDCRKGNRPSFERAARPAEANVLYNYLVDAARPCGSGNGRVSSRDEGATCERRTGNDLDRYAGTRVIQKAPPVGLSGLSLG